MKGNKEERDRKGRIKKGGNKNKRRVRQLFPSVTLPTASNLILSFRRRQMVALLRAGKDRIDPAKSPAEMRTGIRRALLDLKDRIIRTQEDCKVAR